MSRDVKLKIDLESLTNDDLVDLISLVMDKLKEREVISTNNLIGDLGEYLAIKYYTTTNGLPNLRKTLKGTKNVDALSSNNERYSIKTITNKTTGTFHNLEPQNSDKKDEKIFDYMLIVILGKDLSMKKIIELTWKQFLDVKGWHSTMKGWNITVTRKLEKVGKTVFVK